MTTQEFSSGMDILLNSFAQDTPFGADATIHPIQLNEYEKSLFLTQAQEEIVLSLYTGRNSSGNSFDETEELRRYLSNLIAEYECEPVTNSSGKPIGIDSQRKTKFFTLPEDLWFITYEAVRIVDGKCEGHNSQEVVPVTQDEYHRLRKNPFRGANSRRALRLDLPDNMVEIVSLYNTDKYYVRYLRKLKPIILANLDDETIGEESNVTPCELPDYLHQKILDRAAEIAVRVKAGGASPSSNKE